MRSGHLALSAIPVLWFATLGAAPACDLSNFLAVEHAHVNRAEVTLCGTVVRVRRARETRSGLHRIFFVEVRRGNRVEIDANLDVLGNVPVRPGEAAIVRGEYYFDPNGHEGVHWTHRATRGRHQPGYLILDGTRYD